MKTPSAIWCCTSRQCAPVVISGVGGAEDHRDRDGEFDARSGGDAMDRMRASVSEAVALLKNLPHEKLSEKRTIQKHWDLTVLKAMYHVVEHFSMHTGQIISDEAADGHGPGILWISAARGSFPRRPPVAARRPAAAVAA